MIRVLIADDSPTCCALLVHIIESDPELRVVGTAVDGAEAVALTKQLRPDVVVMDVHMPALDGFEATRQIMIEVPTPIVIVSATIDVHAAASSLHALRMGALTLLAKPALSDAADFEQVARQFTDTVRAMAEVRVVRRWSQPPAVPPIEPPRRRVQARIVSIAASTGGPAALYRILSELPRDFPLPVLIVQHIAPGFMPALTAWLSSASPLQIKLAEHGKPTEPRTVYIAPDDRHLGVTDRGTLEVSNAAAIGGFRPSATHLFESVARVYGSAAIAVILTGMGEDGLPGLRAVAERGGHVIAQDESSSVVFGMPGAAVNAGVAHAILPLSLIAARLARLAMKPAIAEASKP